MFGSDLDNNGALSANEIENTEAMCFELRAKFDVVPDCGRATDGAFATLASDGSVLTWGDPTRGGDSSAVAARLQRCACSLRERSGIASQGRQERGYLRHPDQIIDNGLLARQLESDVVAIYPNQSAFAAVKSDGSVVA